MTFVILLVGDSSSDSSTRTETVSHRSCNYSTRAETVAHGPCDDSVCIEEVAHGPCDDSSRIELVTPITGLVMISRTKLVTDRPSDDSIRTEFVSNKYFDDSALSSRRPTDLAVAPRQPAARGTSGDPAGACSVPGAGHGTRRSGDRVPLIVPTRRPINLRARRQRAPAVVGYEARNGRRVDYAETLQRCSVLILRGNVPRLSLVDR